MCNKLSIFAERHVRVDIKFYTQISHHWSNKHGNKMKITGQVTGYSELYSISCWNRQPLFHLTLTTASVPTAPTAILSSVFSANFFLESGRAETDHKHYFSLSWTKAPWHSLIHSKRRSFSVRRFGDFSMFAKLFTNVL